LVVATREQVVQTEFVEDHRPLPPPGRLRWSEDGISVGEEAGDIVVRPIGPGDAAALERFHLGLSRESVHRRFFSAHPRLSTRELERFTTVDHSRREALVVTVGEDIVGVGRFDRLEDTDDAEVAFVVADEWHEHGIATELLRRLRIRAREEGIARFVAETMAENRPMLDVFAHGGPVSERTVDHGIVYLTMPLDELDQSGRANEASAGTRQLSSEPPPDDDRSSA
jgi:RimJ/RimL family protein N-acetyltransferase